MSRVTWVSGVIAMMAVVICSPAFATAYTSNASGNWNIGATWSPVGVPGSGDTVVITSNHVVSVSDSRSVLTVTFDGTFGAKSIQIQSTGTLTVESAAANAVAIGPTGVSSASAMQLNGGSLNVANGGINIDAGSLGGTAGLEYSPAGGTASFGGNVVFGGIPPNAEIDFGPASGALFIGGDLGSGGTITTNTSSTVTFTGTNSQTINGYTFHDLTINKASGTATLNGPISVNGDLAISSGVLDDGGNQITLNGGSTSLVTVGSTGALKLGSAGSSTDFPNPFAGVTTFPGSAVVYQGGVTGQIVRLDFTYRNLYLKAPGSTGSVDKMIASGTITVLEDLHIEDNGANPVTLMLGPETLDVDGSIIGDGNILVTSGSIFVAGDFQSTMGLTLAGVGSTVTYDGTGPQNVLGGASYDNLVVANTGAGTATITGPLNINEDLTITSGILDDGGNQILLDNGNGSNITIGALGMLKLGSETTATSFPNPVLPANVTLHDLSVVSYQSAVFQIIDESITYKRLFLERLGAAASALKSISFPGALLKVIKELNVFSPVIVDFDNDLLDVDENILGDGTIQLSNTSSPGQVQVGGNWTDSVILTAAPGTTVTYDGTGPQNMAAAAYENLTINKSGGAAILTSGGGSVQGTLTLTSGNVIISNDFMIDVNATVSRTSGHFIGPLTMGMNLAPARRFEVGTATSYLPVDADAGSAGTLTIQAVQGLHPNNTGINTLDRYWSIVAPSTVAPLDSVQFNYNDPGDITNGDETKFRLARYSGGIWTDFGDIPETLNYGLATSPAPYLGDWVIGQKGSTGFAGKLAITSVNGGVDPGVNGGFPVDVESQHDNGSPANVTINTGVDILLQTGTGSLLGGFATINSGTSSATASDSSYDTIESNVQLLADASSGDTALDDGLSALFDVVALPTTLTVTSIGDAGPGTLRDAITTVNAGGCSSPCTIDFDPSLSGDIVLGSSSLPVLGANAADLTIDGFTANGASPNTQPFGSASNANITIGLVGNATASIGLEIQTDNVTVQGLAFRNFTTGGAGRAIEINGGANNWIRGCYIGTNNAGVTGAGNFAGINVTGALATNNLIGGSSQADLNVISANTVGISLGNNSTLTEVKWNYIGVMATTASALGNGTGVQIDATSSLNVIGTPVVGNIISGHTAGRGVRIQGYDNDLKGNLIGLNGAGTSALPNLIGVVIDGIDNYIGGAGSDRNVISGNTLNGVEINADNAWVSNNYIGVDVGGTIAIPNGGHGIHIAGTATNSWIGLPVGNRIASNTGKGISLATTGIRHRIRQNAIYNNGLIAIDLGADGASDGPTPNDVADVDAGEANNLQNFPTISLAEIIAGNVDVTVSQNSSAGVNSDFFVIDVYRADASATPQAAEHLGASGCIDTLGTGIFTNELVSVPQGGVSVGGKVVVTATAFSDASCTTASEGTSELSPGFIVNGDVHWIAGNGAWENGANWSTGFLPSAGDNAFIDAPGTYTVTLTSGQVVQSLTIGDGISGQQTLQIAVGPLTINGASSIANTGRLDLNHTIQGTGSLLNNGLINWNSGMFANSGGVTNATAGPAMGIATASGKTLNGTTLTNNAGATTFWSGGSISFMAGGGISNAGMFETNFDGTFFDGGTAGTFANTGTFRKSGGAASTVFTNVDLNHSGGSLEVQLGDLDLAGGTATAPINVSSGRKIVINSNTYTFGAGVSLVNAGKIEVATGGSFVVNTNLNFPALHVLDGLVTGSGNISATTGQTISWDGGIFGTGGGNLSITSSGSLLIGTGATKTLDRTLAIVGGSASAIWSGGQIDIGTTGFINNSGLFESTADTSFNNAGVGAGTFTNTGTLRKSGGAGSTLFNNVELVSSNILRVSSGTVNLANATISGTIELTPTFRLLVDSDVVTLNSPSFPDNGLLQVTGGQLAMNGPFSVPNFRLDAGLVTGTAIVTHTGPFAWNGGTLSGAGTTSIGGAAGSLAIANGITKTLNRTLDIQAGRTATWSAGQIDLGVNGNITNNGTFDATSDNIMNRSAGGTPTFTNNNTLRKSGGTGSLTFTNVGLVSTSATVHIQFGTLNLATASIAGGTVDLDPGSRILLDSDTLTISGITTFPDSGLVELVVGGTLLVNNDVSLPNFTLGGGILDGPATLTLSNTATWSDGTMQGAGGATEIANTATLAMNGFAKALNTRTLRPLNGSTVNWTAGNLTMNTGGNIDNTGLFHVQFDANLGNGGTAGGFVNNTGGTLRKSTTTGSLFLTGISLANNGILDIDLGKVDVTGTFSQGATGSLDVLLGGVVPGTQHGQLVTNSGPSLAGPLNITFNGPYQPLVNDDFVIISWPSDTHVGNFAPYNLAALINGRTWSNFFNATGLHLVVNGGNADVSIVKTAPANVVVGNPIAYTLAVSNAGPDVANSVQVTDTLPAGHTGISAGGGPTWSCGVLVLTVTCNAVSPLNTGPAPNITINATAPLTPGPIVNTASITTSNPDPGAANNSSNANVSVDPAQADLAVTGADPAGVAVGAPVAFTYTITNNGPQTANSVIFTAPIPGTLTFVSATPPCVFSVGVVTCNLGNLVNTGFTSVTINTTASTVGTHGITGSADATEPDPTAANDNRTLSVVVSGATVVVVNTNDSGAGSLRQAIVDANNAVCTAPCLINFNMPGGPPFVITPATNLPALTTNATIDATTQPGYVASPIVEIDGANVRTFGLYLSGTGAVIRGVSVTGNTDTGITVIGSNHTIEGCWVGLNPSGLTEPNTLAGISISGTNNVIGGTTAAQRNVISGNTGIGVKIHTSSSGNSVRGNYIGTNPGGTVAVGNSIGVRIVDQADGNNIGGLTAAEGNVISGNINNGIEIAGTGGGAASRAPGTNALNSCDNNVVRNNRIGVDAGTGTSAVSNAFGVYINGGATLTTIDNNVISGNINNVYLDGPLTSDTIIQNNLIGVGADGTTAVTGGSPGYGIFVNPTVTNTLIGGTGGEGNIIANNQIDGIAVLGPGPTRILGNSIHSNLSLGIDLENDGFTPNDAGDADFGPTGNPQQNFPALTDASIVGSFLHIAWNIDSSATATQSLRFEFYRADGAGEGRDFVGAVCLAGNSLGAGTNFPLGPVVLGNTIVGTATSYSDASCTNVLDGTSEFTTTPITVTNCVPPNATITAPPNVCSVSAGNSASVPVTAGATYLWGIANGTITSANNIPGITFTAGLGGTVNLTVIVTDSIGCTNNGNANPTIASPPPVTITGPTTSCPSAPITLDAGAVFSSYSWSPGGQNTPQITVNPSVDTTYTVVVTDGSGCSGTDSHTVTMNPVPAPTITGPTATCALTPVTLDAGAGFSSYAWLPGGENTQQITVSPTSTTTYSVTVTNALGCSGSDSHTVTVSANPTATITTTPAVCANTTGNSASVPTQAGATYAWTIGNGTITSSTTSPNITYTAGPSGTVALGVTITVGSCTSNGSTNVPINNPPVVNITGPTQSCPSTAFTLDAGGGFSSYLWSNGATSQTIAVAQSLASATYSVTVSNGGCSATDTHTVTLFNTASVAITAPSTASPNESGLVASVSADLAATFTWSISNGTITSATNTNAITFTVGSSGFASLNVSATKNGCTTIGAHFMSIAVPTSADLGVTKTAAATVQAGGTLIYTISVTNHGPDTATDVLVVDTLAPGTTLQSVDGGSLNCFAVLNHVNCMGTAFPGQTSTITITVTAPQQGGPTTNTVEATAVNPDPDPSNNTASATTNVIAGPSACATVPPGLVSPTDGATIPSPQTFSWTSVAGAIEYEVWMTTGTLTTLAGTTAQSSLSLPLTPGTGAWFVIARLGGGCPPLRSAQRTFTASQSSNCGTLVAPQVMSPLGGSNVDSPVNISWTPVPQAIGYRVWAEVNSTAAQDLGTTNGAISLTATLPPGPVVVFVDALFNGCPIARSASVAFNVSRPDPCATRSSASLIAPANDATLTSSSVNLQWNAASAASRADGYRIWFSIDGATPAVLGTTTNETSLSATFSPGVVVWWVEALYNGCASTESNRFRFTIPLAQVCLPNVPALLAPQNNGTLSNGQATFTWTAVQGAVNYELWLATANGTPALVGSTNTTTLTRTLSPGGYAWFVRVTVDRCPPRDSQTSHFTMLQPSNCPERQRPINISPIEGAELTSPITFLWDAPAGATSFDVFVVRGNESPQLVGSTTSTQLAGVTLATGNLRWFVRAHFGQCPPLDSEERLLAIIPAIGACSTLTGPIITAPGQISSGTPFLIQWTPIVGATSYQLQLAGAADFVGAETITTTATQHQLTRTSTVYARARAIDGSCQPIPGISAYGPTSAIFILPTQGSEGSVPVTEDSLMFTIPIGAEFAGQTFTATTREPWLTVFPASGIVGAGGTLLTVTANTVGLPLGTNLGAVTITLNTPSVGNVQSHGTTITIPTMSVSLVTPVTPSPKSGPPPDALIIPAVAHADGINSKFQSDVRVSNTSPQVLKYLLTFTPSGGTGISSGKQTTFSIEPGRTVALDDVLKSWFGTGTVNSSGTLEIRPLTATATSTSSASLSGLANLVTFAASRTFNLTSNGTFGQFIPAIPFSNFVGRSLDLSKPALISLQQIAQSDRYRTNLGIVEGSGQAVSLLVKVFGDSGLKLTEFPVNLAGGEHTQLNAFLAQHGISSLNDGRVEIEVTSSVGKVTAYASVLDNKTSDPLLVTPVTLTDAGATRWVVPGVADLNNGFANWQTDMRVFNAGTTSVDATVSFYSQGGGAAITKSITIPSGQVLQFDKTLSSLFGVSNDGGAVHITTLNASRLITTARTYNQTRTESGATGTYGQFISAVTPAEAAGVGSRPLQILQVEESNRFRSNIGLAEVTGNPVKIEIAVIPPDAKFTTFTQLTLQPNEFRQIGSLLKTVGLDGTFNARVTVRAIEGTGRVTAYASVIDAITNDPTYVPAQ